MVKSNQIPTDRQRVAVVVKPYRLWKVDQGTGQNRLFNAFQEERVVDLTDPTLRIVKRRPWGTSPWWCQQTVGQC